MKILIVDDDPVGRNVLRQVVEHYGHDALEAKDGQEGLEKALQHKPDAIISDALMPKMDGFQFLRAVRQNDELCTIPFVFYTGIYTDDKEYELALSLGADALIVKPSRPDEFWKEFTSALNAHLSKKKLAAQTRSSENEDNRLMDYCRMVAAKLEEKVRELEETIKLHRRTEDELRGMEKALKAVSDEWRKTFDAMGSAVALMDRDGIILRCNRAMAELIGRDFPQIVGRQCWEVVHGASGPVDYCPHEVMKKTRKRESLVTQQGNRWFEVTADPFFDGDGNLLGAVHIMTDVTEQKRSQETLSQSEQRYRNLVDTAQDVIFILGSDGTFASFNPAFERVTGWSQSEIIGQSFTKFVHPDDLRIAQDHFLRVMRGDSPPLHVLRILHRSGEYLYGEFLTKPNFQGGNTVGLFGIARDITGRKKAEQALEKSEEQFRNLFESANDSIFILDMQGKFIDLNRTAYERLGYTKEEMLFKHVSLFDHPKFADRVPERIEQIRKYGKAVFESAHLKKDGTVMPIEVNSRVIDFKGRKALFSIIRDITERKRAEDDIKSFNDLFAAINQIQSQFILEAGPSVIFANVLTSIISLTQSEYGFVGEVLYTADGNPYLRTHAITNIAWNEETKAMYDKYSPNLEFFNLKTLFGEVMVTGKPVISNSPSSDPRRGGLPQGHPPLDSFLGLPFYHGGVMVGMVGIANRPAGYDDQLVEYLDPLLHTCGNIVEAYRNETLRKKAEESLMVSEEKYKSVVESIGIGISIISPDMEILSINNQMAKWFPDLDLSKKPVCYRTYNNPPREAICSYCPTCKTLADGQTHESITATPAGDEIRYYRVISSPIKDVSGKVTAAIEMVDDITERRTAEEAIRESEERYRNLFENAHEMIQSVAPDGHFIYVNPEWRKVLGYNQEDLQTLTIFDILHESCKAHCMELFGKAMSGEPIEFLEATFIAKDGRLVEIEGNASVRMVDGKVVATQGILRDVTERKTLEEQLFQVTREWEETFNTITDMVTVHDKDFNIIRANKAAQKILGLPFLEVKEIKCFEYYHGTGCPPDGCPSCQSLVTGKPSISEMFEPHLKMHIEIQAIPRLDSNNQVVGLIHVVRDISERKKNEEALASYSRELTELNMASDTLMLITNLGDIYQEICNIIYAVFDLKMVWLGIIEEGSFQVKPVASAGREDGYLSSIRVTWDDSPTSVGPTGMAIKTRKPAKIKTDEPAFAVWKAEAQKRGYIESVSVPLVYARDKCLGALNFYSDNSDYFTPDRIKLCQIFANQAAIAIENVRLIEELESKVIKRTRELEDANIELQAVNRELILRREEADAASRSKTDFLANMSHELRTPLNAILGFSEIMHTGMTGPVNEKQKEFLNDISTSGNHLLALITDILDLSKIEAGKTVLEPETFILKELIDASLIMFKEKALKHAIKVATKIDKTITSITADKRKLKQVMVNLLSNAFKFTPDGGSVSIATRIISDVGAIRRAAHEKEVRVTASPLRSDNSIEISVSDTGIGISEEHRHRLFQPFQQIETSLTRKYAGTGLGLSLCRRLVELHGGRIWVESEPGKGSRFVFIIPVQQGTMNSE